MNKGYLHMGHAMFVGKFLYLCLSYVLFFHACIFCSLALQDIMARFNRMRGKATLWLPVFSVFFITLEYYDDETPQMKLICREQIMLE